MPILPEDNSPSARMPRGNIYIRAAAGALRVTRSTRPRVKLRRCRRLPSWIPRCSRPPTSRTSIRSPLRRSEWANDSRVARSLALRARRHARRVFCAPRTLPRAEARVSEAEGIACASPQIFAVAKSPESLHGLPALRQHIERQRVTVGELIAIEYCHRRQHMPDAVIVENVTLTHLAHREAIDFVFVIVSDNHFTTLSAAASDEMRGDVLFSVFM